MAISRAALLASASLLVVAGDRAASDASFRLDGGTLSVGRIGWSPALPGWLVGAAQAQSADAVVLENVRWSVDGQTVSAPRVEVVGATASGADLRALVDQASPTPWTDRLTRLTAQGIRIPELRVQQDVGTGKRTAVYRDLRATDVREGRIGTATLAGETVSGDADARMPSATFGRMEAKEVDLVALAKAYGEPGAPGAPLGRIYASFTIADAAFADPRGTVVKIASLSGRDFAMRPIPGSWRDVGRTVGSIDLKTATPEARGALFGKLADVLDGFAFGSLEANGIAVAVANGGKSGSGQAARMVYDGATRTGRVEQVSFSGGEARGTVDALSMTGFSLGPTIEAMRKLARDPTATLDGRSGREFAPVFGTVRLGGLSVEVSEAVQSSRTPAAAPAPIRVGLRGLELGGSEPVGGIPTAGRLSFDGLTFAPDGTRAAESFRPVTSLGYRLLDLSGTLDTRWDPATSEVAVREIAFSGKDMGTVRVVGTIGGITKDVFDPDTTVSSLALLGANARALAIDVRNAGLFERIVAQQAKAQSLTPEALRREYGTAAAVGIPAILGNSPVAKALGQAVASFVAKPGHLAVSATAKDGGGLGVADFSSARTPAAILDLLSVTATAD